MSFFISILLSLSWGQESTTSAMDAFNKGVFHLLDSDASADPELAEHYFTARLQSTLRTDSETDFFKNTGLDLRVILKWAADYNQGRWAYLNAIRLSFILLHLDHPKKQIYIPKLLTSGLAEGDPRSMLCMALYHYRQPYTVSSLKNARDLLLKIPQGNNVPKEAALLLVNRDIGLFETLPKLAFYWGSAVMSDRVSIETSKLKRVSFTRGTFAFISGIEHILSGRNKEASESFKKHLDLSVDQGRAYSFINDPHVPYTDEEKSLILGIVASQPDHKDYQRVLQKLARICLYQPSDHDLGFQSLGVRLLEFMTSKGLDTGGDLSLYNYRSYRDVSSSGSLNLIDPVIQKLLSWERGLLTNS